MVGIKNCRNYSYSIQYNIVWCAREGVDLVSDNKAEFLREVLSKIIEDNDLGLLDVNVKERYIHVMVDCSPQTKIPNLLKALKGVSGRLFLKEYPLLKENLGGQSLWKSNYFISTPSNNIEKLIQEYIKKQGIKEN